MAQDKLSSELDELLSALPSEDPASEIYQKRKQLSALGVACVSPFSASICFFVFKMVCFCVVFVCEKMMGVISYT